MSEKPDKCRKCGSNDLMLMESKYSGIFQKDYWKCKMCGCNNQNGEICPFALRCDYKNKMKECYNKIK